MLSYGAVYEFMREHRFTTTLVDNYFSIVVSKPRLPVFAEKKNFSQGCKHRLTRITTNLQDFAAMTVYFWIKPDFRFLIVVLVMAYNNSPEFSGQPQYLHVISNEFFTPWGKNHVKSNDYKIVGQFRVYITV